MTLNLFPARVPIGRTTDATGATRDVLMTREFARALSDLFVRVGGANGMGSDDIATLAAISDSSAGPVLALLAEIDAVRALAELVAPAVTLYRQVEAMRAELAMIEDPAAQVRYILTNYAPLLSPHFKGIPTAPTAELNTNTDQLATCKFVLQQASDANPNANAEARPGTDLRYSRADHVHPHDSTKQDAIAPGTVTGSRGGNAALASLVSALAASGLITNNTTA